jgi:hypothetical protein
MRTTVTLDPDVEALVKKLMARRHLSFKEALNQAIRAGLAPDQPREPFRTPTFSMGEPLVDIDRALRLVAELEDQELSRKLARGD